jgi:hypothetical protein
MTALNKQARLVSPARISEIANGANLIMGEKEWLANTAIYLANELKTATKAFQSTGFSLLEAEEKLEAAEKRIAEFEAEKETLRPVGVMSEGAFRRLENSESRFIALWPRPGIYLPRKRPDDGVIVYARTDAGIGVKGE